MWYMKLAKKDEKNEGSNFVQGVYISILFFSRRNIFLLEMWPSISAGHSAKTLMKS